MHACHTRHHHHHHHHSHNTCAVPAHHQQRQRHSLQHSVVAAAAGPSGAELAVWDVVEYSDGKQEQQLRLGLVQQVLPDAVQLSPLIEEDPDIWTLEAEDPESPERQQRVALSQVLRTVDAAYGQRQDKFSNPHGEHAHDVWQVLAPLSAGVWRGQASSTGQGSSSSADTSSVRAAQT